MSLFSERLISIQKEKEIQNNKLSELTRIDITRIQGFKDSTIAPSPDELISLSNALGATVDYLIGKTDFNEKINKKYTMYSDLLELKSCLLLTADRISQILESESPINGSLKTGHRLK